MPLFVVPADGADARRRPARADRERDPRPSSRPRHVPDEIVEAPAVPRTLTGKKLEVPIKRILQGVPLEEAAALGVVDDPEVLEWYRRAVHDSRARERGAGIACGHGTTEQTSSAVDGLPLRVARAGEGPPLLLINGLGAGLEMWNPFVRADPRARGDHLRPPRRRASRARSAGRCG